MSPTGRPTRAVLASALIALGSVPALAATAAGAPARSRAEGRATDTAAARLAAANAALRTGRYEDVERLVEKSRRRGPNDTALVIAGARAQVALGRAEAARRQLERAADEAPRDLPLRRALCEVLSLLGDTAALKPLLDATYDDWKRGRVDRARPDDLLAVAVIVRLDDNWQDANDTFRAAVRAAPRAAEPNVVWGRLFLDKHAVAEAETSFRAALAADPEHPDAHVGLAAANLQSRYDVAAVERGLEAALRVNPRHAKAMALRAEVALDAEEFDAVAALVQAIRATNPRDPDAAWLAAARARLLDDDRTYRAERDGHAAVRPGDGDFFASVAEVLIRHRRTDDARAVAEEGVAADPRNARAQSVLATTLLRSGDDRAGVEALRRAWKRDPYDARTFNLLELYDKVVPRMQTFSTRNLAFRVEPAARATVEHVVAPFLEETYQRYVARYGIEPAFRVRFELFDSAESFGIRTIGMPGIGVDAVCFGRVITSQSPTNGVHNWGMVLAHELAHVFAIELSRSRVPRWFTEGLSELETMRARPEWRRHAERELWGAAQRGELAPLSALSTAFIRARDPDEATRAYAESAAALDFLDRRFGFARIRDALARFGRGERGPAVVPAAMGVSEAALEEAFRADLAEQGAAFARQYLPAQTLRPRDAAATARTPDPVEDVVRAGLARVADGDLPGAVQVLARARAVAGGAPRAPVLFLEGEIALASKRAEDARRAFQSLLELPPQDDGRTGHDGYDVRVRLALAEMHRRDLRAAEEHLRRAMTFDPSSAAAVSLLVDVLGDSSWHGSRDEDRLNAIAEMLRLEPMHAALARELVFGLARRGRAAATVDAATLAIFIDPGVPELHAALARALIALGKPREAAPVLERALALGPAVEQQGELRRLLLQTGVRPRAAPATPPTRP